MKDFKETFRDKVAVFWMIAWPLIWLVLTAYIFIPPGAGRPMTMSIGLVNYDVSPGFPVNGSVLIGALKGAEYKGVKLFNVKIYEDKTLLLEDIGRGRIDAGIIIPENFGENLTLGQTTLEVYMGARSIQSAQINRYMLERFIEEFSRVASEEKIAWMMKFIPEEYVPLEVVERFLRGLAKPINTTFTEVLPEALISREAWIGWYTIGAIGMTMLYSGLNIGSTALLEEKQKGCLHKILASPITSSELIFGKILSGILSLLIISVAIIVFGIFVCGAKIYWNPLRVEHWIAPMMLLVLASLTLGMGSILSLVVKSVRGASSLSTSLGLMLAFMTGIWFPREWFPAWMRVLADYNPATWAVDAIRDMIVFEAGLMEVAHYIIGATLAAFAVLAIGVVVYRSMLRKYLER
ncbi:MAG: ABC transporter permease [Candidatus Bathyarchaeia archaeon]